MRKTKAELVAMIVDLEAPERADIGSVETEIRQKLAGYGHLTGFQRIRAALALALAVTVDSGDDRGTAAAAKELHAVIKALEASLDDDHGGDSAGSERDELSASVLDTSD